MISGALWILEATGVVFCVHFSSFLSDLRAGSFKQGAEEDSPGGPGCAFSIWPIRTQWDQWWLKITWSLRCGRYNSTRFTVEAQGFRTKLCLLQWGHSFGGKRAGWPLGYWETRWLWNISYSSCECYLIYPAIKSSISKWKQYLVRSEQTSEQVTKLQFPGLVFLAMPTHATCPFSTNQTCNTRNTSPVSANWKKKKKRKRKWNLQMALHNKLASASNGLLRATQSHLLEGEKFSL